MSAPKVSVIVPCYNEERTIRLLLDALNSQSFPRSQMEIVIADGMSTDGTRGEVVAFQAAHPHLAVSMTDNPARIIPAALNRAIEASRGEFIVRVDAHARPAADYIARCVAALEAGLGENVGGVWEIEPGGPGAMARSIAVAAAHPLGAGDAAYRHTNRAQHVDTVPFGAFRRSLVREIGPFDESLLTNEDYEFNVRIRKQGGRIWLDPAIRSTYFARASLGALARQYLRYGFWKGQMLKRYPETLRWRQLIPPVFAAAVAAGAFLALFWPALRAWYAAGLLFYLAVLVAAGLVAAGRKADPALALGVPAAIVTMHLCWGGALWWGLAKKP